jgi:tRNA threonylcarbamoyladenosine biosynthesis protein TsaB
LAGVSVNVMGSEKGECFLVLETSGRAGQVAVADGESLLRWRSLDETRRHARDLAPAVAAILAELDWKPSQVAAVFVSQGPGSYTGLRVGIMSAKAFAYATGAALIGVPTFQTIALQAPPSSMSVEVLADAQQDRIYVQRFERREVSGDLLPASPLAIRPFAEWLADRKDSDWLTGPGLRRFHDRLPGGSTILDAGSWDPMPESLLRLALARYRAGERDDPIALEPIYLRPSSAEEKWDARPAGG